MDKRVERGGHASLPDEFQGIGSVDGIALRCGRGEYLCVGVKGSVENVDGSGGGDGVSCKIHDGRGDMAKSGLAHSAYTMQSK